MTAKKSGPEKLGQGEVLIDPNTGKVLARGEPKERKLITAHAGRVGVIYDPETGKVVWRETGPDSDGGTGKGGVKDKDVLAARDKLKGEVRAALGLGTTQFDKLSPDEKASVQAQYQRAAAQIDDDKNLEDVLRGKTDRFMTSAARDTKRETATNRVRGTAAAGSSGVDWSEFGVK